MIPLSGRHALLAVLVLALLAIPVWIHAIAKPRTEDCARPDRLLASQFLPNFLEHESVIGESTKFFSTAWGTLRLPGRWSGPQRWRINRTYRLQRYQFKPPGMFTKAFPEDLLETRTLEIDGILLPVQLRTDRSEGVAVMTAYIYVFAGKPITNPFRVSVANALGQLTHGTYPMTMILLSADAPFEIEEENRRILVDEMGMAFRAYREACEGA